MKGRHALLILLLISNQALADPARKTEQVKQKLEGLNQQLVEIETLIKKDTEHLSDTQQQLAQTDKSMAQMTLSLLKTQRSIRHVQDKIEELTATIGHLDKEKQALLERLSHYMKKMHLHLKDNPLKIILKQQKVSDVHKISVWYEYMTEAETSLLKEIRDKVSQSEQAQTKFDAEQKTLVKLKQTFQNQKDTLLKTRQQQVKLANRYAAKLKNHHLEQKELLAQQTVLQNLLAKLEEATQLQYIDLPKRFEKMFGKLPLPIQSEKIEQYAFKESYLQAKEGTQVRAIHSGRVVFSEWLRGLGLLMIIDHGGGYMSLYGNNQILFKSTGEWVNEGDQIALVGKSGGQSKPGLYFEIRKDGSPLPTQRWMQRS